MNTINKTMMVAAAIAAVFGAVEASAANFTYNDGDLLLNFRYKNGATVGAKNLTIDIGAASSYQGATAQIPLNQFSASDLNLVNNTSGNFSFFNFSVLGTLNNTDNTLYTTRTRVAGPNYNNAALKSSIAFGGASEGTMSSASSTIATIGQDASAQGAALTGNKGISINDASPFSYHSYVRQDSGNETVNLNGGWENVETSTGSSFTGASFVRADLYKNVPDATGAYLGYFQFNADGSAFFAPQNLAAVPEPSTYGIIAGLGLVALSLRNRASRKQA